MTQVLLDVIICREMLTSVLSALVKNPIKENFYEKRKTINILTTFFIFYKNNIKTFFN